MNLYPQSIKTLAEITLSRRAGCWLEGMADTLDRAALGLEQSEATMVSGDLVSPKAPSESDGKADDLTEDEKAAVADTPDIKELSVLTPSDAG